MMPRFPCHEQLGPRKAQSPIQDLGASRSRKLEESHLRIVTELLAAEEGGGLRHSLCGRANRKSS